MPALLTEATVREAAQDDAIPNNRIMEPENAVQRECAAKTAKPRHRWFSFLCGGVLALLFMELVLHNFSGKTENSAGFEERDYREGFAKAHFLANGLRVTGNPQIAGAPSMVLMGDSHVEAYSVWDEQTIGSILERRLRAEGKQINVLQYGWRGADGADYVYQAQLIKDQFHPDWIFLVTSAGDFTGTVTEAARLVERDGRVIAEGTTPASTPGRPPSYGSAKLKRLKESGLIYASVVRLYREVLPLVTGRQREREITAAAEKKVSQNTVDMIARGLNTAYGGKLVVLYAPGQPYSADEPPEIQEAALLSACQAHGMSCLSLRAGMIDDLLVRHKFDRGYSNTPPGTGHLSVRGQELVAEAIYARWKSLPK